MSTSGEQVLSGMLEHEYVRDLLRTRGYDPKFVEHCEEIIGRIVNDTDVGSDQTST